jgi:O-antigen/teichoic acid export membrane protein
MTSPIKAMLAFSVSLLLSKLMALGLQPFITHWLGLKGYGTLDVLITFSSLISLVIIFGFIDVLYRFAHDKKYAYEDVLTTAWQWVVWWGSGLWLSIFFFRETLQQWLPAAPPTYAIVCLSTTLLSNALSAILLARLKMEDKATTFMWSMLIFSVIQATAVILFTPTWHLNGLITAGCLAQCTQLFLLRKYIPKSKPLPLRIFIRYGAVITLSGVLGFLYFGAERWIIADILSPEQLAPYAIAMQWSIAASLLIEPFNLWWFPRRLKRIDTTQAQQQTANISVLGCQFSIWIAATSILLLPIFLIYWLPVEFHASATLLPLLVWAITFKIASTLLNVGSFKQTSGHSVFWIAVILTVIYLPIVFLLIPKFGLMGAVYSAILIQGLRLLLYFFWSQRLLKLPYPLKQYALSLLLLLCLTWAQQTGHDLNTVLFWVALNIQIIWPWRTTIQFFLHKQRNE